MNQSFFGFGPADEQARAFRPAGLTGAHADARLAGATPSGAPTAGTFRKGDVLPGQDGTLRICTVGGSPGTWVQVGTLIDPTSVRGDLIVRGASATTRLALGTTNYVLTSNGTDAVWSVVPAGAGGALTNLGETILGTSAATIDVSSIPGTYRHLRLDIVGRSTQSATATELYVRLNGDSAANYDFQRFGYNNGVASSEVGNAATSAAVGFVTGTTAATNAPGSTTITLWDYARTQWEKTLFSQNTIQTAHGGNAMNIEICAGLWRSTAAVTEVTLVLASNSFAAGTIATLWGMA